MALAWALLWSAPIPVAGSEAPAISATAASNYRFPDARGLANYIIPVPPDFPERMMRAQRRLNPCALPALPEAIAARAPLIRASSVPGFDIVRIARDGTTVIAGRSEPRATVKIFDCGKEIGRTVADARGGWVYSPGKPLPPGTRQFTLRATSRGGQVVDGLAPVVLVVPDRPRAGARPDDAASGGNALALKVPGRGAIRFLQTPAPARNAGRVSIGMVHYGNGARLAVSGGAPTHTPVNVYVDDKPLASARADVNGAWRVDARRRLSRGNHPVRADMLADDGKVAARAEVSYAVAALPQVGHVTVAAGDNLWRIARRSYGNGFDYIVIYKANKAQIRDPDRVYPGQVLRLPREH